MPGFTPLAQLTVSDIGAVEGFQVTPPLFWHACGVSIDQEAGSDYDGRYITPTGEIEGPATPLLQDTYKTGSSGRTGRPFTVVSGDWYDDWVSPWSAKYGLLMPNGTNGTTFEVLDTAAGAALTNNLIVIRRGMAPTAATKTAAGVNAYLELSYLSTSNWRVALEWGQPVRLDWYDYANGAVWRPVAYCRSLGNVETILAQNNGEIRLQTRIDRTNHRVTVEVGDGNWMQHRAMNGTAVLPLPARECYRFSGINGWASLEVYPLRFAPVRVNKSQLWVGRLYDTPQATLIRNCTGQNDGTQTDTLALTQNYDGSLTYEVTGTKPDSGDTVAGSEDPPTYSDINIYIPGRWEPGALPWRLPVSEPQTLQVHELLTFDEATRTITSNAHVVCDNRTGSLSGAWGNYAANIYAGALVDDGTNYQGYRMGQRMYGMIAGPRGISTMRQDPIRLAEFDIYDTSYKLGVPIGCELVLDGWCIYSAVRMVLELGQIPPWRMGRIPYYPPGSAGYDCPYPILGRGSGLSAKYKYGPERTAISILLELVQEAGLVNPFTGANVPFVTGQDPLGFWYFEPYDPRSLPCTGYYSEWDTTGYGQIEWIRVFNSVENMRTEVVLQGQDPFTYELLQASLPMPWNYAAVGYRYPWFERDNRWCSQAYLETLIRSAAMLASIPQQTIVFQVPYQPYQFPGDLICVYEGQNGAGFFVVTQIDSLIGMASPDGRSGETVHRSIITARAAANLTPW